MATTLYHVNTTTGNAGPCSATSGKCPFGGPNVHYASPEAARTAFEGSQAAALLPPAARKASPAPGNAATTLSPYSKLIEEQGIEEVYIHPQGKVVLVDSSDRMKVFKNGSPASTSGSLEDLRDGRGAWKLVPKAELPIGAKAPVQHSDEDTRRQALVAKNYPVTSTLDPRTPGGITVRDEKTGVTAYSRQKYPAAILPVDNNLNPHKGGLTAQEWLSVWGTPNRPATVEVWESANGSLKAVATSGTHIAALGSGNMFRHDQTFRSMGDNWTLIGAFEGKDGGGVVGRVPNRSMPLYTYK
jgi:hypothetical protein